MAFDPAFAECVPVFEEGYLSGNIGYGAMGAISQTTGTFNDFPCGPTGPLVFTPTIGGMILTGLVGNNGQNVAIPEVGVTRIFVNAGPGTLTLNDNDSGSAAGNRFTFPGGADLPIPVAGSVTLYWSPSTSPALPSVWILISKNF